MINFFFILEKEAPKAKIRPEPKKKGNIYLLLTIEITYQYNVLLVL